MMLDIRTPNALPDCVVRGDFWRIHLLSANEIDLTIESNVSRRPARTSLADTEMIPLPCHDACPRKENSRERTAYFLRNEQPSVSLALPPVGWQRTVVQPWQMTTVWACEKTVVIVKQPGHLTSMKKERGAGTRVLSLCLRASATGLGFNRSTARTILIDYFRMSKGRAVA
jgi:hypothetical protein